MPMNEYGEIIRNSYPPPEITSREVPPQEIPPPIDSGIGIFAFFLIGIVIIAIIGFIIYAAVNKNNDTDSNNSPASDSGNSQAIEETMADTVMEEDNATVDGSLEYILPSSDSEYISYADLEGLSQEEVVLARNEIYARRGRKFTTDSIRIYFESKSWYHPIYAPEDFSASIFNEYEKENIQTIVDYEKKKGWR